MSPRDRRWPPEWARDLTSDDVDEADLYLAIEAGGWPVDLPAGRRRAFTLLVLASIDARGEGATRLGLEPTADLEARLRRLAAAPEDRAGATALAGTLASEPALAPLVGRLGDYRPFIVDGDHLYQERDLRIEMRLAGALAARLAAPPFEDVGWTEARAAATAPGGSWTSSQSAALEAALGRRLTVVTGGPGSGKTALIGGIVEAWMALGLPAAEIAVAAPTGKAAHRIAEILSARGSPLAPPSTLHRLLGYSAGHLDLQGGEFRHHENRPLPHAAVIVDEASMVGLPLLEQLTRALRPDARLVLLGDADQLPAIQAGSVFRDLGAYALRLAESHRMDPADAAGARVLEAARGVARGELADTVGPADSTIGGLTFSGFETLDAGPGATPTATRRLLTAFVDHWYATHLRAPADRDLRLPEVVVLRDGVFEPGHAAKVSAALERQRGVRLLTVTRVGPTGADRINATLGQRALQDAGVTAGDALAPGTPVMMTENDYDRGLMNGDQGIVVWAARDGGAPTALAVFPRADALVPFPLATLRGSLTVAYAMTVHKAQGSELDRAALILPEIDLPMLSRELIYTAVTRARRSIVVVGSRALLAQAIARPLPRSSDLADRLTALGARPATPPQPRP